MIRIPSMSFFLSFVFVLLCFVLFCFSDVLGRTRLNLTFFTSFAPHATQTQCAGELRLIKLIFSEFL